MSKLKKQITRREFVEVMALGAAGTLALSIGGPSLFAATPKRGGVLKCGMSFLIQSPDPQRRNGTWGRQDAALTWEGLVDLVSQAERFQITKEKGVDKVPEVKPMLADSWDIEKGGARYVFHLKKGVKFHDGKEFDSGDVKWNWERIKDPIHIAAARKILGNYLKSIETPDRHTVVANLTQPYASFLIANAWVNAPLYPKDSIPHGKIFGESGDYKPDRAAPPGTGPFEMVEFQQNQRAFFKAFKDYRIPGLPYLDGVEMLVVKDQPRTMALRAGNVDYIYGVADEYLSTAFRGQKLYQPFEKDNMVFYPRLNDATMAIYLNSRPDRGSPFHDERVRQALSLSIDRKQLAQALYGNQGIPTIQGFQPSESQWGFDDIAVPEPDIAKAKQLLAEAGYPNGIDIEFKITPTWGKNDQMAQVVQQMARAAGIRIKITTEMGLQYWGHLPKMDYQMFVFTVGGDDPMGYYYGFLHSDPAAPNNGYSPNLGVKDPELDQLLDDMAKELDPRKRREFFKKVVLRANEKAYFIPYLQMILANGWSKKLKNFNPWNYYIQEQAFREAWLET